MGKDEKGWNMSKITGDINAERTEMTAQDAFDEWMAHDEWQFADQEACWKFMFEKGQESMRQQLTDALAAIKLKDALFEKIACLGNGDIHGNSFGNDLGKEGLAIQPDDSALKAWLGEPVASMEEALDAMVDGVPLYAPKGMKNE